MTEQEQFNFDYKPKCYWQDDALQFDRVSEESPYQAIRKVSTDHRIHMAIPAIKQITIAKILIGGGKKDVILIRAYKKGDLIHYKIADMLHFDWGQKPICAIESSTEPLTLAQLIKLIDRSDHPKLDGKGLIRPWLERRIIDAGPDNFVGFVQAKSDFYPELQSWYQQQESQMLDEYYDLNVSNKLQNIE